MGLDDGLSDGKSEAGAAILPPGAGAIDAVKSFEEMGDVFPGDPRSGVLDGEGGLLSVLGERDCDLSVATVVFYGIAQEIKNGLAHALGIEAKGGLLKIADKGDLSFFGEGANEFGNFPGKQGKISFFLVKVEFTGIDT